MIATSNQSKAEKRRRRAVASLLFMLAVFMAQSAASAAEAAQCSLGRAKAELDEVVPTELRLHPGFRLLFEDAGAIWRLDETRTTSQGGSSNGSDLDFAGRCAAELLYRTRFEQALRMHMHETGYDWDVLNAADDRNTEFLRAWLGVSGAGVPRSWTPPTDWRPELQPAVLRLALHARDTEVQQAVLELVGPASTLQAEGALQRDYARLVDRVAVNRGEPQRFGTQRWIDGDCTRLFEIEDPDHLAKRRADFGLPPLSRDRLCDD